MESNKAVVIFLIGSHLVAVQQFRFGPNLTFVGNLFAVTCNLEVPDDVRIKRHFFLVQGEGMVWEKAQGGALHCAG